MKNEAKELSVHDKDFIIAVIEIDIALYEWLLNLPTLINMRQQLETKHNYDHDMQELVKTGKTQKSTSNSMSIFGLNEKNVELSRNHLAVCGNRLCRSYTIFYIDLNLTVQVVEMDNMKQILSNSTLMDYVRHGKIQGRNAVFFKAHGPVFYS